MAYGPSTRTVQEVLSAIQRLFGDESGVQLANADVVRWINDAQDVIVDRNHVLKAHITEASVSGQAAYSFADALIHSIDSIHYGGYRLPNISFAEAEEVVLQADPLQTQAGTPQIWYEYAGTFTFWPTPTDGGSFDLYYTKRPTRIVNLTDLLTLPDKFYQLIVLYCIGQAYTMDEDMQAASQMADTFDKQLASMGEDERVSQHMTYDTITVYDN